MELPYGAPLVLMTEVVALEGEKDVKATDVMLLILTPLEEREEVTFVTGTVGSTEGALAVAFPYGAPLVEKVEEMPLEIAEWELVKVSEILVVLFVGTAVLLFEKPVVTGAVG